MDRGGTGDGKLEDLPAEARGRGRGTRVEQSGEGSGEGAAGGLPGRAAGGEHQHRRRRGWHAPPRWHLPSTPLGLPRAAASRLLLYLPLAPVAPSTAKACQDRRAGLRG